MHLPRRYVLMCSYFRLWHLQQCLESLDKRQNEFDMCLLWDNCSDRETQDWLRIYENHHSWLSCNYSKTNVGKAVAINEMSRNVAMKVGVDNALICNADSDIVFHENTLEALFTVAEQLERGIVMPEHDAENGCHLYKKQNKVIREKISTPYGEVWCVNMGEAVAGACMTMKLGTFRRVGGFKENSIYGGNEGGLYEKYFADYPEGKGIWVLQDQRVLHLPETDIGYKEHKRQCQRQLRIKGKSTLLGYYDKQRKESMEAYDTLLEKLRADHTDVHVVNQPDFGRCRQTVSLLIDTINDKDALVIVGTMPEDEGQQALKKFGECWIGQAWKVVADLRTKKDLKVVTYAIDQGVTVVTKGRERNRLDVGGKNTENMMWVDYQKNYAKILNLVPLQETKEADVKKKRKKSVQKFQEEAPEE